MHTRVFATVASVFLAAACSAPGSKSRAPSDTTSAATPPTTPATADVHPFKIGALDAVALRDGLIRLPNDGKTFGLGQPRTAVDALLTAAGLPTDTIEVSIEPLLVKSGPKTLLFDTGAGSAAFAVAGKLQASLNAAGVQPEQVTDIFISHAHPDHVGGLVSGAGALVFPNAAVHLSAPEWAAMKSKSDLASVVAAITPKVATFQPGAEVVPGVTAVPIEGHTAGHSGYEIASNGEKLLFIGDAVHHAVLSVQRPDWDIAFDENRPVARASRQKLLQRAADENLLIYAGHLPFPGLGHVRKQGAGFVWVPE